LRPGPPALGRRPGLREHLLRVVADPERVELGLTLVDDLLDRGEDLERGGLARGIQGGQLGGAETGEVHGCTVMPTRREGARGPPGGTPRGAAARCRRANEPPGREAPGGSLTCWDPVVPTRICAGRDVSCPASAPTPADHRTSRAGDCLNVRPSL